MWKERQLKRKHFLIAKCVRGRGNYPRSSSQIVFLPFILVVFTLLASCTGTSQRRRVGAQNKGRGGGGKESTSQKSLGIRPGPRKNYFGPRILHAAAELSVPSNKRVSYRLRPGIRPPGYQDRSILPRDERYVVPLLSLGPLFHF